MASTIKLVDNTEISVNDEYTQVDDVLEYTSYCANYTELNNISSKLTQDNMKTMIISNANNNEMQYNNMICANPKFYIVDDSSNIEFVIRFKRITAQDQAESAMAEAIQQFDDEDAKNVKVLYPDYMSLIGRTVNLGFKLTYYNVLYKVAQPSLTISKEYAPGAAGTESLFIRIDETHQGTKEDPIPYFGNQILEKGKIYIDEENTLWICTRDTGIAVFDSLINLQAFVAIYHDAAGTVYDPIMYFGGIALEQGKYYIQDGITYECIRNSEIPVYNDLKDLVDNYVKEYNPIPPVIEPEEPEQGGGEDSGDGSDVDSGEEGSDNEGETGTDVTEPGEDGKDPTTPPTTEPGEGETTTEPDDGDEQTPTTPTDPDEGEETPTPVEPGEDEEEAELGSLENPIEYNNEMALEQGKYYIQDDAVYQCTRSTGIAVYNDLKDLVDIYVKVVSE